MKKIKNVDLTLLAEASIRRVAREIVLFEQKYEISTIGATKV